MSREGSSSQIRVSSPSVSPLRYAMELPSLPHNPYHPPVLSYEQNLNFSENFTEEKKADLRKINGIISCAGLASRISSKEIMFIIEYYNLEVKWMRSRSFMRMHIFEIMGLPTPRMVLTNRLVELGFGSPTHDFLHQVINFYNIAPI